MEIKNFSQDFLKETIREHPLWNMHLSMIVSKNHCEISAHVLIFLLEVPLDHA